MSSCYIPVSTTLLSAAGIVCCLGQRDSARVPSSGQVLKTKTKMVLVCKGTILTQRPQLVGVVSTSENRGCRMVSVTNPHGHNLGFVDWSHYYFFPSSSSTVLVRLSGLHSRPTTSQEIWCCQKSNLRPLDL
jgi:hypothetical protein